MEPNFGSRPRGVEPGQPGLGRGRGRRLISNNYEASRPRSVEVGVEQAETEPEPPQKAETRHSSFNTNGSGSNGGLGIQTLTPLPGIIVQGLNLGVPYQNLGAFPLNSTVDKGLRALKIKQINPLQRCVWPQISKGRNCFIVGKDSPKGGKTLSYLVPFAGQLITDSAQQREVKGPSAIILCSSTSSAIKIETQLTALLQSHYHITIYRGSRSGPSSEIKKALATDPDIIICKSSFMTYLQDEPEHRYYLNRFRRLSYLICDDSHILLEDSFTEISTLIDTISYATEGLGKYFKRTVQYIFCGEEWNERSKNVMQLVSDPILVISSPTQGVAFAGVKINVELVEGEQEKFGSLVELIKKKLIDRCLVVCTKRETVLQLGVLLYRKGGILASYIDGEKEPGPEEIKALKTSWENQSKGDIDGARTGTRPGSYFVMITTDEELKAMELQGVRNLINYDMPKSEAFGLRHCCMWDFPKWGNSKDNSTLAKSLELNSYVFLTPDTPDLFKIVVYFQQMLKVDIPLELEALAEELKKAALSSTEMCQGVRLLGKCNAPSKLRCEVTRRHDFTQAELEEEEATVPKFTTGRISLRIVQCNDVNNYEAQLLSFQSKGSAIVDYQLLLKDQQVQLNAYYAKESNRTTLSTLSAGALCATQSTNPVTRSLEFLRATITDLIKHEKDDTLFRVRFMDIGGYKIKSANELFDLPAQFSKKAALVGNVIVANIKPYGDEDQFSSGCKDLIEKELKNKVLSAEISLSVGNTIWVDTLIEQFKNPNGDLVEIFNLRSTLIEHKLVENNSHHLTGLYTLIEKHGLDCQNYRIARTISKEFQTMEHSYEWATLSTSSSEFAESDTTLPSVLMMATFIVSPAKIYACQAQFCPQLDILMVEMHNRIEELISEEYLDYHALFERFYEEGLCVAAKDEDGAWSRAIILELIKDSNGHITNIDVFFVDHGETGINLTIVDIFPIPRNFVELIPFQVIALGLAHVKPVGAAHDGLETSSTCTWSDKSLEFISGELQNTSGQSIKFDVVPVAENRKKPANTMCNYYGAQIFVGQTELGLALVQAGYAKFKHEGSSEAIEETLSKMLERKSERMVAEMIQQDFGLGHGNGNDDDEEGSVGSSDYEDCQDFSDYSVNVTENDRSEFLSGIVRVSPTGGEFDDKTTPTAAAAAAATASAVPWTNEGAASLVVNEESDSQFKNHSTTTTTVPNNNGPEPAYIGGGGIPAEEFSDNSEEENFGKSDDDLIFDEVPMNDW